MRKRGNTFLIRLDDDEYELLQQNVAMTGLPRETYVRKVLCGVVPKQLPNLDYISVTKQLRHIGNNINQIVANAHKFGIVDTSRYENDARALNELINTMMYEVTKDERQDLNGIL